MDHGDWNDDGVTTSASPRRPVRLSNSNSRAPRKSSTRSAPAREARHWQLGELLRRDRRRVVLTNFFRSRSTGMRLGAGVLDGGSDQHAIRVKNGTSIEAGRRDNADGLKMIRVAAPNRRRTAQRRAWRGSSKTSANRGISSTRCRPVPEPEDSQLASRLLQLAGGMILLRGPCPLQCNGPAMARVRRVT